MVYISAFFFFFCARIPWTTDAPLIFVQIMPAIKVQVFASEFLTNFRDYSFS